MSTIVNPKWKESLVPLVRKGEVDQTVTFNGAAQWLILELSKANRAFKVYNLGAGVKRITTETDTCPCCKKKL